MKKLIQKKAFPYVAAFFLPFVICIVICIGNGVYPFGDNCILHIDMYHQYCPFFTELWNKLQTGGSLQYSWNLGLGSDFVSLYAYYLASPLNFLLLLCKKQSIIEFMTLLILVKIALCGLTFFIFLKYRYQLVGKDNRMHANQMFPALVFSTAYALSGFVAAYSWDIMWMDCIALFPLIMVGLLRLVQEKKPGMYFVTLAVSIFANYYISIMICIFLVFYFALLFFQQKEGKLGALLRFIWYSALAGAASAVLLLPEIAVLGNSGSVSEGFPKTVEWYFSVLAEFGRGAAVTNVYTGNDHWPNLYAGAFCLVLIWLYVLNRRISWKEKVPRLLMLAFFLISFANNRLDYIWHGMHFPQALPGRESFLYIFLLLSVGFETVRKWKGTKTWHIVVATAVALVLIMVGGALGDETVTDPLSLIITGLLICVYGILMLLTKLTTKQVRLGLRDFTVCIAVAELFVNMAVTGLDVTSRVAYTDKQDYYPALLKMAEKDNGTEGFYRVEDNGRKTKNDDALYGYPSATIFSSLINLDVSHFYQMLYLEGGKNFYSYNGATPLPSAMLSVRYLISSNPVEESRVRTLVGSENGNYLYRNNYCLPLGFMMDEETIAEWKTSQTDRIGTLNNLAYVLGAEEDMIEPGTCTTEEKEGDSAITVAEDGYYYADYVSCDSDTLTVTRSDGWTKQYSKTTHRYLIELGECEAGTEIHITNQNSENIVYHLYKLNFDALESAYDTLRQQTMELTNMTDRTVEGTIDVKESGRLVFSIPADKGWKVYVDGKETETKPLSDALLAVPLQEGTHEILLRYTTPGLAEGAAISFAALFLFLLSIIVEKSRHRKR